MRDAIFRLKSEHTCQLCYNPIGTTFMGSSVGYDLFRYWANYKNYYEKFENNENQLLHKENYGGEFMVMNPFKGALDEALIGRKIYEQESLGEKD